MLKLLKANLYRLKKSNIFYIFIGICFGSTVIYLLFLNLNNPELENISLEKLINNFIIMIGLFICIFVSLFVGREYSDGIIKNKIIPGHKRKNIYLSNLLTCIIASFLGEIIYIILVSLVGVSIFKLNGLEIFTTNFLFAILNTLLIIIAYTSIFNFIAMIIKEITVSEIISFFTFIIMFLLASSLSRNCLC